MKLHIYLFRHGQTTYNRDEKFTGFHNPPLTSLGIKQAQTIAKKLKNKQFQIAIHTSLTRSKQTLKEVLKYHPECKKILTDNRMIERNYGSLNGTTHSQLIQKKGLKYYNEIHRGFNTIPPKGESFKMVETRVHSFINDLKKRMKKTNSNIAISAHGNSIRLFRKIMEKASKEQATKWNIPYDKVYTYTLNL
ncbi:MAG TPA: phosphoglycerate mutase family protein [Candidatus Nanoarchaeia archaeon]|nr:phosphoglycerate mutase family protein [Candidatus Nanoarchaeia archaeon]